MKQRQQRIEKFRIVLIKPSKYDDEGYVIRFWKGVLPSNTLNVLHGLTEDVKQRRVFGDLPIEVTTFDETAEKVPLKKILRWGREAEHATAGLYGWRANQSISPRLGYGESVESRRNRGDHRRLSHQWNRQYVGRTGTRHARTL